MSENMNNEANRAIFNNIFRSEYSSPILNDSTNEFNQYLNEAILSMNIDPLDWWKLNCTRFPNLSQMAKDYLAIQST
ncbi:23626_t:CDS:2 [Gigaspora rosea]|nr:23626_t:CDS:2 [Gigaspora rosea]